MCLNIKTPKNHYFSSGTNGNVAVLGVPILNHFMVKVTKIVPVLFKMVENMQMYSYTLSNSD